MSAEKFEDVGLQLLLDENLVKQLLAIDTENN